MKHPEIMIKIDRKLDQDLAWEFYSLPEIGGCNFWEERALKHHKKLLEINSVNSKKDFLNKYVLDFYESHTTEINKAQKEIIQNLDGKKEEFLLIVDKIFKKHPWPKKIFTGYLSIFDFCPRFLDSGEFQVFMYDNKSLQLFTIFHEMLHFMFYDFIKKEFSKDFKNVDTEKGKLWDLAEVFNAVIQDTDDFVELHGKIKNIGYPNHKDLILRGKNLWESNPDIKSWIVEIIK